ncbi:MAG: hypothetical protein LWW91_00880 [Bacteroidales bacterium]|nr:hypothetical protein [Bacteroidales bacterium]ODT57182.1 MAG: hypothetical protein ABS72_00655 [Paludibacter sp. SCN 50-10]OJX90192.1 MAG: hypothetical protein BGP01_14310 [Paludibacter sp. 47-17]
MKQSSLALYAQVAGSAALVAGSLFHFFDRPYGMYVFGAGALILILFQLILLLRNPAQGFREQRIQRMNFMVSLVLALAVYSMVDGTTLWIAAVLIYALVTLFLSFRS